VCKTLSRTLYSGCVDGGFTQLGITRQKLEFSALILILSTLINLVFCHVYWNKVVKFRSLDTVETLKVKLLLMMMSAYNEIHSFKISNF
jgi:hypothetical protein